MSALRIEQDRWNTFTFFRTVLRLLKKPVHYRQLFEHLALHYAGRRNHFVSIEDSIKLLLVKNGSIYLRTALTGYVSSVENEMLERLTKQLRLSAPQHFLKLIQADEVTSTFFKQSYDHDNLEFFKYHTQHFTIQNDEYVELSKTGTVLQTFFDKNKAALLIFLTDRLKSRGPMYFSWLLDYMKSIKNYRRLITNEPCAEDVFWNFLQNQNDFVISDGGFVDLSPHLKSIVKVDASISVKEDEVIGFFVAKLAKFAFFNYLNYMVLLKMLQDSTLNIRRFFAKHSLKEIHKFFIKHPGVFRLQGKSVTLQDEFFYALGMNSIDFEFPYADLQEVMIFFLNCLKKEGTKCILHLTEMLKNSKIKSEYRNKFLEFPECRNAFFRTFPDMFYIRENGCVSLYLPDDMQGAGKCAIQHFTSRLKVSSSENFWTLISSAEASCEQCRELFAIFPPLFKWYFFLRFPTVFNMNSDGYVSNVVDFNIDPEVDVIDGMVKQLNGFQPIHFEKLCISAENSSPISKAFLQSYSLSQKFKFFKSRPDCFFINSDGLVSIPSSSHNVNSKMEETMPQNASKSSDNFLSGNDESIRLISRNIENVIDILKGHLNIHRSIHFLKLCKNANYHFRPYSATCKFKFFENLPEHFHIDYNGYVTLSCDTSGDMSVASKYQLKAKDDDDISKILLNVLKKEGEVHYEKLCNSDDETVTYFKSFSTGARFDFFKNRPKDFLISCEGYVSLPQGVTNSDASVLPCRSQTSKLNNSSRSLNSESKDTASKSAVLTGTIITDKQKKLGNIEGSVINSSTDKEKFPIKIGTFGKYNANVPSYQHPADFSQTNASDTTSVKEASYVVVDSNIDPEVEVIDVLVKQLNDSQPMHFKKLCLSAENSSQVSKALLQSYSLSQKFKFFKDRPKHFLINSDGLVSIPSSSHNVNSKLKETMPQSASKSSDNFLSSNDKSIRLISRNIEDVIDILKGHLNIHKRMHCLKLCQKAVHYFQSYSATEKFQFFKNLPEHFCITTDNYVTLPCSSTGDLSVASRPPPKDKNGDGVTKILLNVLKRERKVHYEKLLNSDDEVVAYFKSFSADARFDFFKNRPKDFSISCRGDVSLSQGVMDSNTSVLPCRSQTSKSNNSRSVNSNSKNTASKSAVLIGTIITDKQKKLGNIEGSVINSNTNKEKFPIEIGTSGKDNANVPSDQLPADFSQTNASDTTSSVKEASYVVVDSDIDPEIEVIDFLVKQLNDSQPMHFKKLCLSAENSSQVSKALLQSYSLSQKFKFFKDRPKHFLINSDGLVSIPSSSHNVNSKMKETMLQNASKSSDNFLSGNNESIRLISRNIGDIIDILKGHLNIHKRMHCLKLCQKAVHYFQSYSATEKFQFFKNLPEHFCIATDNYVTLPFSSTGDLSVASRHLPKDNNCDDVTKILLNVLKREGEVHYEKLCNSDDETVTYFNSFSSHTRFEFFRNRPKDFLISCEGYVSLPQGITDSDSSGLPCRSQISNSNNGSRSLNLKNKNTAYKSTVLTETIMIDKQTNWKLGNIGGSVIDSSINKEEFPIEIVVSKKDNATILSDQHLSDLSHSYVNDMTSSIKEANIFDIFRDCIKGYESIRYQEPFLYVEKSNEQVKYDVSKPLVGRQCEIIETLVSQLKARKHMHFLKLCKSSEEINITVENFFHFLSNADRLDFLKSCPQYFSVDDDNVVTLSSSAENLLDISVPYKELYESNSHSNMQSHGDKQSQDLANDNDAVTIGRCIIPSHNKKSFENSLPVDSTSGNSYMLPSTSPSANETVSQDSTIQELPTSGTAKHVSSNNKRGLLAAAAYANSAEGIIEKIETEFKDMHLYNAFPLPMDHQREIVETLLAVLKIGKRLHFSKLCKLSKELNEICRRFFYLLSNAGELGFLKNYPQYFFVDDENFVTLSNTA